MTPDHTPTALSVQALPEPARPGARQALGGPTCTPVHTACRAGCTPAGTPPCDPGSPPNIARKHERVLDPPPIRVHRDHEVRHVAHHRRKLRRRPFTCGTRASRALSPPDLHHPPPPVHCGRPDPAAAARVVRDLGGAAPAQAAPWMAAHQADDPSGAWGRTASPGQGPRTVNLAPRPAYRTDTRLARPARLTPRTWFTLASTARGDACGRCNRPREDSSGRSTS